MSLISKSWRQKRRIMLIEIQRNVAFIRQRRQLYKNKLHQIVRTPNSKPKLAIHVSARVLSHDVGLILNCQLSFFPLVFFEWEFLSDCFISLSLPTFVGILLVKPVVPISTSGTSILQTYVIVSFSWITLVVIW